MKLYTLLLCFFVSKVSLGQATLEMTNRNFSSSLGPTINPVGPINFERDNNNTNQFSNNPIPPAQLVSLTVSLANQTYTGLTYSNVSTGLMFGASPTTAVDPNFPAVQKVDPNDTYNILGSFNATFGGPTNDMFTSSPAATPTVQSGTGIIADGVIAPPQNGVNNGVGVFTAAQVLFDLPGGPAVNNTATRYYYGNVVLTFNRFVQNPVIHIAGLGGSYRYFPVTGGNVNNPADWRSTFFTTELEVQPSGFSITRMSGNQFFNISGNNVLNSSTTPNGASVPTVGGLFQDLGAASGSFRINGTVKTVVLRVYLRGADASQFPWSTVQANVAGANRNPFTGDIWWVAASTEPAALVPLPSTGVNLTAALNGNDVLLKWKTLTEVNSSHFEIERSTDGRNFTGIATKIAAGNSITEINYDLTDPNMTASVYYYRLKQVDVDSRFTYSNIAIVRKSGNVKAVKIFPNPVQSQMSLEFSNARGNYVVSVFNQAGQEVITQKQSITFGVQYVTINRNSLASGNYFVRVKNMETSEVLFAEKIVLQ